MSTSVIILDAHLAEKLSRGEVHNELILQAQGVSRIGRLGDKFASIRRLDLSFNTLVTLDGLEQFPRLRHLSAYCCRINDIEVVGKAKNLVSAMLQQNGITFIPNTFRSLIRLKELRLDRNQLPKVGGNLCLCTALQFLDLSWNKLDSLEGIAGLQSLKELRANSNAISSLRPVKALPSLEELQLSDNQLGSLDGIEQLPTLRTIVANNNKITTLRIPCTYQSYNLKAVSQSVTLTASESPVFPSNDHRKGNHHQVSSYQKHYRQSTAAAANSRSQIMNRAAMINDSKTEWLETSAIAGTQGSSAPLGDKVGVRTGLPSLTSISLQGNRIASLAGLETLSCAIEILDLSDNLLRGSSCMQLLPALSQLKRLEELRLEGNPCCLGPAYHRTIVEEFMPALGNVCHHLQSIEDHRIRTEGDLQDDHLTEPTAVTRDKIPSLPKLFTTSVDEICAELREEELQRREKRRQQQLEDGDHRELEHLASCASKVNKSLPATQLRNQQSKISCNANDADAIVPCRIREGAHDFPEGADVGDASQLKAESTVTITSLSYASPVLCPEDTLTADEISLMESRIKDLLQGSRATLHEVLNLDERFHPDDVAKAMSRVTGEAHEHRKRCTLMSIVRDRRREYAANKRAAEAAAAAEMAAMARRVAVRDRRGSVSSVVIDMDDINAAAAKVTADIKTMAQAPDRVVPSSCVVQSSSSFVRESVTSFPEGVKSNDPVDLCTSGKTVVPRTTGAITTPKKAAAAMAIKDATVLSSEEAVTSRTVKRLLTSAYGLKRSTLSHRIMDGEEVSTNQQVTVDEERPADMRATARAAVDTRRRSPLTRHVAPPKSAGPFGRWVHGLQTQLMDFDAMAMPQSRRSGTVASHRVTSSAGARDLLRR